MNEADRAAFERLLKTWQEKEKNYNLSGKRVSEKCRGDLERVLRSLGASLIGTRILENTKIVYRVGDHAICWKMDVGTICVGLSEEGSSRTVARITVDLIQREGFTVHDSILPESTVYTDAVGLEKVLYTGYCKWSDEQSKPRSI